MDKPIIIKEDGSIKLKIKRKRGRPKKEGVRRRYNIPLSLWEGEDDDLIKLLDGAKNRAALTKAALRGSSVMAMETCEDDDDFDDIFDDLIL